MDQLDRDTIEVLAAEHVLGLLGPTSRHSVIEMAEMNPDLAEAIEAWEMRLGPLAAMAPAIAPRAGLWSRIAAETIDRKEAAAPLSAEDQIRVWRRRAIRWKTLFFSGFMVGGSAVAAMVALVFVSPNWVTLHPPAAVMENVTQRFGVSLPAQYPPRPAAAVLVDEARDPYFTARLVDAKLTLTPTRTATIPDGKTLHLWIWTDPKTLIWLGEITAEGGIITLPAGAKPGNKLCISLESPGTIGTGLSAPPGPQAFVGRLIDGVNL